MRAEILVKLRAQASACVHACVMPWRSDAILEKRQKMCCEAKEPCGSCSSRETKIFLSVGRSSNGLLFGLGLLFKRSREPIEALW